MKRTRQEKLRLGFVYVLISAFFVVALARLVHLQVFLSPRYHEIVVRQSTGSVAIPAERGAVYDRFGQLVARNVIASSLYAYPRNDAERRQVAAYLDNFFGYPSGTAMKRFRLRTRRFSWVQRLMSDKMARRLEAEAPNGLYLREESRRTYPFGTVGKQILGFTDVDNKGRAGFEFAFDSLLAGQDGYADIRRDGLRNTYRVKETALVKPVAGTPVVLSIDWRLQDIVEDELRRAVDEYNGRAAMAVFMDCNRGDILAMAHYDPEETRSDKPTKLRAVTDMFEPGSVFKPFTAAGLLDAGLINFDDTVYCENGRWKVGRRILHDDKEREWLTFREIMELSSNIGIAKCALKLDTDDLMATYRRFGFGCKPHCGLPGETSGLLSEPSRWSDYNVAALSMGHSVAVSALQLAMGFAAIANGGRLLQPRLLVGQVDRDGYVITDGQYEQIGRAANTSSCDSLRAFLRGVVEFGTATPVNSEMVSIAGKTGTAEIPNLENGGYHKNKFNGTFAGFFPSESPVVAGVVVVVDPKPIHYGGHTAGPAFRRIAERYTILNPDLFASSGRVLIARSGRMGNTAETPDLIGRDIALAKKMTRERGIVLRATADEGRVIWQFPPADRVLFDGDEVIAVVESPDADSTLMADVTGLPIRTVAAFLHHQGIKYAIEGSGRVYRQSIPPGSAITTNEQVCRLQCRPS